MSDWHYRTDTIFGKLHEVYGCWVSLDHAQQLIWDMQELGYDWIKTGKNTRDCYGRMWVEFWKEKAA